MKLPGILSPAAISGLVALTAVALYDGLTPREPKEALPATLKMQERRKDRDVQEGRADLARLEQQLGSSTWSKSTDEFGPFLMRQIGTWAGKTSVGMVSVRPQKTERTENSLQYNYLLTMEGGFPNMVQFLSEFETPGSLLSVRTLQISSADGESDRVRANIGVIAYAVAGGDGG
ncbi:MAG: hypothetical protein AB7F50_00410 [Fimbriimonadaceae bacterium]